jgi:hypothetical protein
MELNSSTVHRRLDAKIKIVGLEAHDLLFVLLFAATMNLIFGQTPFGTVMVFVIPIIMALILFFIKRNKPENYLIHLIRFHMEPGHLSAGETDNFETKRNRKIYVD